MKKNSLVVAFSITLGSLFLTGCNSNSPEGVAKSFVESFSKGDIEDAKKVSAEKVQKNLNYVADDCLTQEVSDALDKISQKDFTKKLSKDENKKISEAVKELKKELNKKDFQSLSPEKKREFLENKISEISKKYLVPKINDTIEQENLKLQDQDAVALALSNLVIEMEFFPELRRSSSMFGFPTRLSGEEMLNNIIHFGKLADYGNVSPKCISKKYDYIVANDMNVIENEKSAPDKARVRLEIINKDGKSQKVTIRIEKIKGDWKVVNY